MTVNFTNAAYLLRLPDSGRATIYFTRLTLVGLPALPLSYRNRTTLPSDGAGSATGAEPAYALPMWFVRVRDK